jgi:hypothetical protein
MVKSYYMWSKTEALFWLDLYGSSEWKFERNGSNHPEENVGSEDRRRDGT